MSDEPESSEEPDVNVFYDCHNGGDLDEVWLEYRLHERRRREEQWLASLSDKERSRWMS